jgi:hypothetical protein
MALRLSTLLVAVYYCIYRIGKLDSRNKIQKSGKLWNGNEITCALWRRIFVCLQGAATGA